MTDQPSSTGAGHGLRELQVVRADVPHDWRESAPPRITTTRQTDEGAEGSSRHEGYASAMRHAELRYLRAVLHNPDRSSSEYPKLAGVSPRRGMVIRERLVQLGHLRTHTVNRAGRGRDAMVLEVTESGIAALQLVDGGAA